MAKYTTLVRTICEEKSGLKESVGCDDIEQVLDACYDKIFDVDKIPMFDANHAPLLFKKILLHYYMREIGFETVGLWKMKLNSKMREIMPYYNQLYQSELLEYNPLQNVDNTHTHAGAYEDNSKVDNIERDTNTNTRNLNETESIGVSESAKEETLLKHSKVTQHGQDETSNDVTSVRDQWSMFSDTPQGGIDGVVNAGGADTAGSLLANSYLTNATHVTDKPAEQKTTNKYGDVTETYNPNGNNKDTVDTTHSSTLNRTKANTGTITDVGNKTNDNTRKDNGTDNYTNKENGKIGVETYQEMVMKYRETFLNIDMQIINELKDLFMKVW